MRRADVLDTLVRDEDDHHARVQRQIALPKAGRMPKVESAKLVEERRASGETDLPLSACPETCPYSARQARDHGFWPGPPGMPD